MKTATRKQPALGPPSRVDKAHADALAYHEDKAKEAETADDDEK